MTKNKPYDPEQRIISTTFLGAPSVYSAVDIDRQEDLQSAINDQTAAYVGGSFSPKKAIVWTVAYDTNGKLTWKAVCTAATFTVRGAEFTLNFTLNGVTAAGRPVLRLFLVGIRRLATFSTDPVLCGLDTTVFPDIVAGASVSIWDSYRVVYAEGNGLPVIAANEEVIAALAAVAPEQADIDDKLVYLPVYYYEGDSQAVTTSIEEGLTGFPSMWQSFAAVIRFIKSTKSGLSILIKSLTTYEALNTKLRTRGEIQYVQSNYYKATDYDNSGKGLKGTQAYGWQLCNGNNGTPNYEGITLIGGTNQAVTEFPYGATGGERMHQLTVDELPRHNHTQGNKQAVFAKIDGKNTNNLDSKQMDDSKNEINLFGGVSIGDVGNDETHNNMQPYEVVVVRMWIGF
jgi:microcystin-dependent protein